MNTIEKGLLVLLKSAILQKSYPLPEGFSMAEAMTQIKRHGLATLAYDGAVRCGVPRTDSAMQSLFQTYCRALMASEGQMQEIHRIFSAFEANGIEYMPLKGCNMKALYPQPELRTMGDADILIRMEQYDRIVPIMTDLGFQMQAESDHELIWKSPKLMAELHKRLIPSYNKDFYAYFGDGWQLATVRENHRHFMQPEDEFIYLFTHFAKHFRDGGIGCRHVVDLWVWLRANRGLKWAVVENELDKLCLKEFCTNIRSLIDAWFEDSPTDEKLDFIGDYILASGNWGDLETRRLSVGVRDMQGTNHSSEARAHYIWRMFFPNMTSMGNLYPVLKKHPWLLPFTWLHRIFCKVFVWRVPMDKHKQALEGMTQDKLDERKQALAYMGIGYHF